MTSATTLVHWLGTGDPPAQLVAHLKTRGLTLAPRSDATPLYPVRLASLPDDAPAVAKDALVGRRVAVLHTDPGGADVLAQALRRRGATVSVLSLDPNALDRFDLMDPDVVLVEPADFTGGGWEIVRSLWAHPWLRWPTVLVTTAPTGASTAANESRICHAIKQLGAEYDAVSTRVGAGGPFEGWLATLGPARTLRALVSSGASLRVRIEASAYAIEVDVGERLVLGARELDAVQVDPMRSGARSLARLLRTDQAHVLARRATSPTLTNLMVSFDDAIRAARLGAERPSQAAPAVNERDSIPTVRPPNPTTQSLPAIPPLSVKSTSSARVYPFPSVPLPPPASLRGSLQPAAPRAVSSMSAGSGERASVAVSAAALDMGPQMAWAANPVVIPPLPASPLQSGIVEISDPLGHDFTLEEGEPAPASRVSTWIHDRLTPPARRLSLIAKDPARKPQRQAFLIAAVLLIGLGAFWYSPWGAAEKSAPTLSIRVRKITAPPPVKTPEPADENLDEAPDPSKSAVRQASEYVSKGHALRHEGKLAQAENYYRLALKVYPGYPRALTGLSRAALERGDAETAVRFARILVRSRPRQGASHLLLGDAHRAAGNMPAANGAWRAAAKLGDRVAKSRLKLGSARAVSAKVTYRAYMKFQGLEVVEHGTRRNTVNVARSSAEGNARRL